MILEPPPNGKTILEPPARFRYRIERALFQPTYFELLL